MELAYWSVRSSRIREIHGVKGEIVILARCKFTLLENMKIWCKIQVLLYPLSGDFGGLIIYLWDFTKTSKIN